MTNGVIGNDHILLVEYQKAQDSAEHHDNLIWTTTGIILGGMLILIGSILRYLESIKYPFLIFYISLLSIALIIFLWKFQESLKNIKIQKYDRCKDIEKDLKDKKGNQIMKQHSKLSYIPWQTYYFKIVLAGFVLFWIFMIYGLCC